MALHSRMAFISGKWRVRIVFFPHFFSLVFESGVFVFCCLQVFVALMLWRTGFVGSAEAGSSFKRVMDGMKGHRVYCNVEYITTLISQVRPPIVATVRACRLIIDATCITMWKRGVPGFMFE